MRVTALDALPRVFHDEPFGLRMRLRRLDPAAWLLVSEHYAAEIALKRRLLDGGADVLGLEPQATPAVEEGLVLIEGFLATHHPELPHGAESTCPLRRAGLLVQEDLCWLAPSAEGYRLVAAFVAFPSRWRLASKMGRVLPAIHAPVPGLDAQLGPAIGRFFAGLTVERPVWRANWSLLDDPKLHQPAPEARRRTAAIEPRNVGADLFVRVERQTFRRLPATGTVMFTIHSFVAPLDTIAATPQSARALARRLAEMPAAMRRYKGLERLAPLAQAHLARRAQAA